MSDSPRQNASMSPRESALTTYSVNHWSDGYVDISEQGDLLMRPGGRSSEHRIHLPQLIERLRGEGLRLPMLLRFGDILHDRVNRLCQAFASASREQGYEGGYTAVYPIKVNQQRRVVESLLGAEPAASQGQIGLEAGSKPELLAVLALSPTPGATIVCNGYKDREYIRLALMGQALGHRVFLVVEKHSELRLILSEAKRQGIRPLIGVRARLASIGHGNWQNTGGEKSKFGLSASQVLALVAALEEAGYLDSLQLLHFHLGSQIANIRDIQTGLRECGRFYQSLRLAGAPVSTVDIGGGLGVDYEGTRSRSDCSMNYNMNEYARAVVQILRQTCDQAGLPHPHIISESGRALTAHHAVLVTNVIDEERPRRQLPPQPREPDPAPLLQLWQDEQALNAGTSARAMVELYHDAAHAMGEMHQLFAHGIASLEQRAAAEQLYTAIGLQLRQRLNPGNRVHRDILDELNEKLADKLFVNLSLFQSLPDIWGIGQIFPILPLNGLHRPLTRRGILQDITCDSDGRIDRYVEGDGIEVTLPMPALEEQDSTPLMAFFLTGAYQEILGDQHNLFGDTDAVDLWLNDQGECEAHHSVPGDTVASVLRSVNFDPVRLSDSLHRQLGRAELPEQRRQDYASAIESGLSGYTYLGE
ncbi:MAG: biosynthetic arginine decarboxylase [Oleiphilaceae bacterium]|nr:biosynthetic arginine decarboxylase [Oleiphilaceae bacterium]